MCLMLYNMINFRKFIIYFHFHSSIYFHMNKLQHFLYQPHTLREREGKVTKFLEGSQWGRNFVSRNL